MASTHVSIPAERLAQLKRLQIHHKQPSIADTLGMLISDGMRAAKLDSPIPDFKIERINNVLRIEAAGAFVKKMNREEASSLAAQIRDALKSTRETFANPTEITTAFETMRRTFVDDIGIAVVRRGSGLKLVDTETKGEKTVAPSIARDIADLIDKTVKE